MTALTFTKRPVEIEAIEWTGSNIDDVLAFVATDDRWKEGVPDDGYVGGPGIGHTPPLGTLDIPTLEGTMTAQAGDWIIRGVKGELYPCKPDIFRSTYFPDDEHGWCEGCGVLVLADDRCIDSEGTALCVMCWEELVRNG